jgi:hypothetical protein
MNKLSYLFKFGTVSLVVAAAVQCSSITQDSSKDAPQDVSQDAEGKIHGVKDVAQDAEGKIHGVKDVTQDAEGKIHGVKDVSKNLAKHLSKNLV